MNTYDVLRAAGLVPDLRCHGCERVISADVVPWPGEGYVTHPNDRCAGAAYEKERQAAASSREDGS